MALNTTTLGAAAGASDLTLKLASVTNAIPGVTLLIDSEYIATVTSVVGTTGYVTVRGRGSDGTAATSHANAATVTIGNAGDFTSPLPAMVIASGVVPARSIAVNVNDGGTPETVASIVY